MTMMADINKALASTNWQSELMTTGRTTILFDQGGALVLEYQPSGSYLEIYANTDRCDELVFVLFSRRPHRPGQINGFTGSARMVHRRASLELSAGFTTDDFSGASLYAGVKYVAKAG